MYIMLENYGPYTKGQRIVVVNQDMDWFRTNKGIYVFKNLTSWTEMEES